MSSKKKLEDKSRVDFFRFRKQSTTRKILLIITVFLTGSFLVYALLTISMNRWDDLGIISVWVLFGWLFFVMLFYISFKLISLLMHKEKTDKQKSETNKIISNPISSTSSDQDDD